MSETIIIKIINWDKFNPKRAQKTYTWLRLSNDISTDPKLFGLTCEQKYVWIEMLCQASKSNKGEILVNLDQLAHVCQVARKTVELTIQFLKEHNIITTVRGSGRSRSLQKTTPTRRTNGRTNETDETNEHFAAPLVFDVEGLYEIYPRKEGRQRGVQKLRAEIKTPEEFASVSQALTHYITYCKANQLEQRFIKHFSTWVSEWKDWLDPKTGTGENFKANPIDEIDFGDIFKKEATV